MTRRFTHEKKGYDCKHVPCQHNPPGDHGISGGRWIFALASQNHAVSLTICTSFYPETVPRTGWLSGWPEVKTHVTGIVIFHRAVDAGGDECDFLAPRRCETEIGGYLICDQFAPLLADTFEPQSEAFWAKLESLLDHWVNPLLPQGADTPDQRETLEQ
jgi:hypothetical protein